MNSHTLSAFHRKIDALLALTAFLLLALTGITNSFAQEAQSITLSTNKNSYMPGDVVQLSGTISAQPSGGVALEVKDSDGNLILIRTVPVDQNGNFALQFKIPPTATSGNFSVISSARVNGFIVTQAKVFAATVPEFGSVSSLVLSIGIISIIALATKTRLGFTPRV